MRKTRMSKASVKGVKILGSRAKLTNSKKGGRIKMEIVREIDENYSGRMVVQSLLGLQKIIQDNMKNVTKSETELRRELGKRYEK